MSNNKNTLQRALDLAARAGQLEASGCQDAVTTAGEVRVLLNANAQTGPFLESVIDGCEYLLELADQDAQAHDSPPDRDVVLQDLAFAFGFLSGDDEPMWGFLDSHHIEYDRTVLKNAYDNGCAAACPDAGGPVGG